jgi:hypothetical protein
VNPILGVLILAFAMAIIEAWDFRWISIFLGILGGLLIVESILVGVVLNVIPLAFFALIFIPITVYFVSTRTKFAEEPALIRRWLSIILLIVLVISSYAISFFLLGSPDIQWSLILVGVYGLLSKTDLRKIVASVAILTYAVHLLVPAFDVVIEGTVLAFSGGLIIVLLLFAIRFFELNESLSTRDLRKLRY